MRKSIASILAVLLVSSPAAAVPATHTVTVDPATGTFSPKYLEIRAGDSVEWVDLGRSDAVARIASSALDPATGGTAAGIDTSKVCSDSKLIDPGPGDAGVHIDPLWSTGVSYTQAFDGLNPEELSGPARPGVSGIWALGPEGGKTSYVEIPSDEADVLAGTAPAPLDCDALTRAANNRAVGPVVYKYEYHEASIGSVPGNVADARTGDPHVLCEAFTYLCTPGGTCLPDPLTPDPGRPETIAPGTYLNGLLTSTYENPDITGVVLRFNWRDLQYDDAGTIRERWEHLERELERAIAHGKLVTLDVRAGMFGTPPWIFDGYEGDGYVGGLVSAHPSAAQVEPITFVDYYDEPDLGCGTPITIGAPGDPNYRALYTDFIARLAARVASDARWFQAVAPVKVSGANLRTSEAELPHSCGDGYTNTAVHATVADNDAARAAKDALASAGDRVLDTFKYAYGGTNLVTHECECNPQTWFDHDYEPAQLYEYYAQVERQIVDGFFGRKSLGYQIIQDGFPRADVARGSYFGDHLYRERLTAAGLNEGTDQQDHCSAPSDGNPDPSIFEPEVFENRTTGGYEYCSSDQDTTGYNVFLALDAVAAPPGLIAPYSDEDRNGVRYPAAFEQSVAVLEQAGDGYFMDHPSEQAGKLFVPQHSGLQPMGQEQIALGYSAAPSLSCRQQRTTVDTTTLGWPAAASAAVGRYVAQFPMPESTPVSALNDPGTTGCPNRWIVDQGKDLDDAGALVDHHPPQLTGFQTTNRVRIPGQVESSLFNLTYNSNAVFIELYEDSLWLIASTRGVGTSALAISDPSLGRDNPAIPGRLETDGYGNPLVCVNGVTCYSKNLSQWSAELHGRRLEAERLWAAWGGHSYPGLVKPFPRVYRKTFAGPNQLYAYINPGRCDHARVDTGPVNNGQPSSLGVIRVLP